MMMMEKKTQKPVQVTEWKSEWMNQMEIPRTAKSVMIIPLESKKTEIEAWSYKGLCGQEI